ncbi:hypothetical protein B0H10DRAFT_1938895 [Mycena sp. CBHHK59/15]|nr:hypothetical protein B0H10DRAFT_1938895 [Mycena sp. CBHHK59/15]
MLLARRINTLQEKVNFEVLIVNAVTSDVPMEQDFSKWNEKAYTEILNQFTHLSGVHINQADNRENSPIPAPDRASNPTAPSTQQHTVAPFEPVTNSVSTNAMSTNSSAPNEEDNPLLAPFIPAEPNSFEGIHGPIESSLCCSLTKLSAAQCDVRIDSLQQVSEMEVVCENNIAKNKEALDAIGLHHASDPMAKRKGWGVKGGWEAKRTKGGVSTEDGGEFMGNEEDIESSSSEENTALVIPHRLCLPCGGAPAALKDWAWNTCTTLESTELGLMWVKLVGCWWEREQSKGFDSPAQGHSTKRHPKQVKDWVQCASKGTTAIHNVETFMQEVQNWFLNVLICLKWQCNLLPEPLKVWTDMVEDVTTVLNRMNGKSDIEEQDSTTTPHANTPANPTVVPSPFVNIDAATLNTVQVYQPLGGLFRRGCHQRSSRSSSPTWTPIWTITRGTPQANPGAAPKDCKLSAPPGNRVRWAIYIPEGLLPEELKEFLADMDADMNDETLQAKPATRPPNTALGVLPINHVQHARAIPEWLTEEEIEEFLFDMDTDEDDEEEEGVGRKGAGSGSEGVGNRARRHGRWQHG